MSVTRRWFMQQAGMAAAAMMFPQTAPHFPAAPVEPTLDPKSLTPFVDPLPLPPIVRPLGRKPIPSHSSAQVPYYRLAMRQFEERVHRDMKPTRMWGIGGSCPGPTIESRSGDGLLVEWANELPTTHFLPIDHSILGASADKPDVRTVIHLHGAKAPPESDGYPENWYVPGKSATYHYPNEQDATLLWYHDHAMGIHRLNVLAGMFGLFVVRDGVEDSLNLPSGKYEIPLVLYDRTFNRESQLYYPVSAYPDKPWLPQFYGNTILVNGRILPYLEVEGRKYRFRVLNAANGRFFHLSLSNRAQFHQIGTDQGLLAAPVALNQLSVAPA